MANDHAVAVDMMNRYSSQSSDNQRLMNYWTQPPTVVVEPFRRSPREHRLRRAQRPRSGRARARLRPQQVHRPAPPACGGRGDDTSSVTRSSRGRDPQRRGSGRSTVLGRFAFYRPGRLGRRRIDAGVGRIRGGRPGRHPATARRSRGDAATRKPFPPAAAAPARRAHLTGSRVTGPERRLPSGGPVVGNGVRSIVPGPPQPGGEPSGRLPRTTVPGTSGEPPTSDRRYARRRPPSGSPPGEARRPQATASCRWAVPGRSEPRTGAPPRRPTSSTTPTRSPTTAGSPRP